MSVRTIAVLSLFVLLVAGCSSVSDNATANIIKPEVTVRQVGGQAAAAAHVTGGSAVQVEITVANNSSEPLTLERMQFETMGSGAYTISPQTRPINLSIDPGKLNTARLWLPMAVEDTILGANGPVTLRAIGYFSSSVGKFSQITVQQLNTRRSGSVPTSD